MRNLVALQPYGDNRQLRMVRMVVESPRGSNIKFDYEPELRAFTVSRALPLGLVYLSATLFTDKQAKVTGWGGPNAAHKLINASLTCGKT